MGRLDKNDVRKLLDCVATIFFDCDGVLWDSHGVIQGSMETIQKLRKMNKQLLFITNSSAFSRKEQLKKFHKFGFDVKLEEILSSAYVAAVYVKDVVQAKKVFFIGSSGMREELEDIGMKYVSQEKKSKVYLDYLNTSIEQVKFLKQLQNLLKTLFEPRILDEKQIYTHKEFMENFTKDHDVGAVIVAYDPKFSLFHIAAAMQYLSGSSIPYIATNTDNTFPIGNGKFGPGTGCIVNAVSTAVDRQPIVVGKPNKLMFETALSRYNINANTSLMIGDRLNTDIVFGNDCGMQTLCVLTGVTSEKEIVELSTNCLSNNLLPTYYTDQLSDLLMNTD